MASINERDLPKLRAMVVEFLSRVPDGAALPLPKGQRETYACPVALQGWTRDELEAFARNGAESLPMDLVVLDSRTPKDFSP